MQRIVLAAALFSDAFLTEKGIKEVFEFQPKACSIWHRYCRHCLLTSDQRLTAACANRHQEKKKYWERLWTFSLGFWVAESSPSHEYQGQPTSIIHNPAVLRYPYLHLYCRTSKWLSLFNNVAATFSDFSNSKTSQSCSGAESVRGWAAGWWIYKQGLVISYLPFELLNRVLWWFLNAMRFDYNLIIRSL